VSSLMSGGPGLLGGIAAGDLRVLPSWLRRPVRLMRRLTDGSFTPPRFSATIASAVLFGLTGLYGSWAGGHMPAIVQAVTSHAGFALNKVHITGNRETSEIDVLDQIGLDGWTSMIGFNAHAARKRIATLPWVESVSVQKVYPATVNVRIVEKKPFAIWQHDDQLSLIQQDGAVIAPLSDPAFAHLPLIVGDGGPQRASAIVATLQNYPSLVKRVKGYIRVGDRRWDLMLDNGMTIKLPEQGQDKALADIVRMDSKDQLLSRDIVAVDMRMDDRIVVELSHDAFEARQAMLKARDKQLRKAEKNT
jgi:cell division protein FtsQ